MLVSVSSGFHRFVSVPPGGGSTQGRAECGKAGRTARYSQVFTLLLTIDSYSSFPWKLSPSIPLTFGIVFETLRNTHIHLYSFSLSDLVRSLLEHDSVINEIILSHLCYLQLCVRSFLFFLIVI